MKKTVSLFIGIFLTAVLFQDQLFAFSREPSQGGQFRAGGRSGQLISPLCECSHCRTTSSYGQRWGRLHAGHDIGCPTGTPIRASSEGVVRFAGRQGAYGNRVEIVRTSMLRLASGGGYPADQDIETSYSHLSAIAVAEGTRVQAGDVIGYCGSTGRSTGPHLHYEVRVGGVPIDPRNFFQGDILRSCPGGSSDGASGVEV